MRIKKLFIPKTFTSYLIYALGELLVITAGIYIAIQLDNWKEEAKQKEIELKTLHEIKRALVADSSDLYFNLSKYRLVVNSCDSVVILLTSQNEISSSQYKYFSGVMLTSFFLTNTGPYETLKSRGLEIITNDDLRLKLTSYYEGNHDYIKEIESELTQLTLRFQNEVAINHFEAVLPYNNKNDYYGQYGKMVPDNIQSLRRDTKFIKYIKAIKAKTQFYIYVPGRFAQEEIRYLVQSIDNETREFDN